MNKNLHSHPCARRRSCPVSGGRFLALALLGIAVAAIAARGQAQTTLPRPDHIVIVIEENKGLRDIVNSPDAPYINSLATQGASLTNFYALHHPSQPNYMELFSGASQGIFNDTCPKGKFAAPNLGGDLIKKGRSFKGYAENLPSNLKTCTTVDIYGRKHCPWIAFKDVPDASSADFTKFPQEAEGFAQLPTVSFVIPNLFNDMHSLKGNVANPIPQEVANGDAWLKEHLDAYVQWAKANNSLFIVTWDEDGSSYTYPQDKAQKINTRPPHNHIATILVGAPVKPGATSDQRYTHYDLLRTIEDMYNLPLRGGSQGAKDITGIWK